MDQQMEHAIFSAIEGMRDELAGAVSDMVKIKSVTPEFGWEPEAAAGGESAVNEYTLKLMQDMGIEAELFAAKEGRSNLCGVYKGTGGGKSLLFNGHVDVVPPGDLAEWNGMDPFSGKVDGEFVYGRGSVDMKGGNAAALFALKGLLKAGCKPKGDVVYQHVVGEECKVTDAGTGACLDKGCTAHAAIVCEPTCSAAMAFEINPASPGIFEMKWQVKGKSCHVGMRREVIRDGGAGAAVGVDAVEKGMVIYNAIKELERQWGQTKAHPMYKPGNFCINGATIKAGVGPSFIAPDMEMSYAIMYPPQDSADDIKAELEACIHNACQNDPWLRENPPEITWIFNWPSFDTDTNEDICGTLQQAVRKVLPGGGAYNGFFAVCDASFVREKGIPVVIMGPGDSRYTHGVEEKVAISQLVEAAKIYALAIAGWCGIE